MEEGALDSTWTHPGWLSGGGERRLCKIIELNSPDGHRAVREGVEVQGMAWGKAQRTESVWPIWTGRVTGVHVCGLRTEGTLVIFRGGNRF